MRNHLVVVYGGGGFRGKWEAWREGVASRSLPSTCAGENDSAGSHRGGVAVVLPPFLPPTPTAPPLINLDEISAEYSSRAFKPLANCN